MSGQIGKTALIVLVIGVMAYLCWPYLSDPLPEALALSPGKMPEIAPALLAPPVAPAPLPGGGGPAAHGTQYVPALQLAVPRD